MGKPLGLGSFAIRILSIKPINRILRYRSFASDSKLTIGHSGGIDVEKAKDIFAKWYFNDAKNSIQDLWNEPRFRELKALLTWDVPANVKTDWLGMTRYLEFDRLEPEVFGGRNYNEYNEIGAGEPGVDRPRLSKTSPASSRNPGARGWRCNPEDPTATLRA